MPSKMKLKAIEIALVLVHISAVLSAPQVSTSTQSLVVSSTEPSKESVSAKEIETDMIPKVPKIYEMNVRTNVSNRFASTLVTSKVKNLAHSPQQATFSVILPEKAYISGFIMEIDGKSYKAYVKEKEEAKQIYDKAVESGQAAAHVEASARDSNRFTVSVNVEPQSKATFKLNYEELLQRQSDQYEIVLNIHPGQPVKVLDVEIFINESRPLKFVRTPSLRTGNEVDKNSDKAKPSADISITNQTAVVKFNPDEAKQKKFASYLGTKEDNGLAGQFVVQYDVERDPRGGEVLVKDGYFVHFFAPSELKPLPKHVVFVLDTSGSMGGIRIQQLKEAMNSIMTELKPEDIFNIVEFGSDVKVWNVENAKVAYEKRSYDGGNDTPKLENKTKEQTLPEASPAHGDNILQAKKVVDKLYADGGTNILSALEVGLNLVTKTKREKNRSHQPMIIFLTDGEPTVGEINTGTIISKITELNAEEERSPIFSLSFGDGADRNFLQKISLKNLGFARHIYEAADASLQLQEFYRQISSPLLSNVSFKYTSNVTQVTRTIFPIFFLGSEIVICGTDAPSADYFIPPQIIGHGFEGVVELKPRVEESGESLERLWAYLTIKQVLEQRDTAENKTLLTQKALGIALKYSFVTPVSSLVVVKPNDTGKAVDIEDASKTNRGQYSSFTQDRIYGSAVLASLPGPDSGLIDLRVSDDDLDMKGDFDYSPTFAATTVQPATTLLKSTTTLPTVGTTENVVKIDPYAAIKAQLPWLKDVLSENGILYFLYPPNGNTYNSTFKLGVDETLPNHPPCPLTPGVNGTAGVCTLLPDCPQVFPLLPTVEEFAKFLCRLDKLFLYAGVCCPVTSP